MVHAATTRARGVRAAARQAVLALIVPAVLAGCDAAASPEEVDPITVDALMAHVAFLSDDSLYGRRAGWEDELTAAEYVRDRFVAAGVSPGLSRYLQEFWVGNPLAASAFEPGGDPHRVARPWSQNVIGVLPGAGALADEWIVVGAHYDHIGWSLTPDSALEVYNGADDNGSGTAVLIELARYLASRSRAGEVSGSRRSIMFQGYGAEEIGLVGSTYYCENPIVPLTQVAAMVNFDMVGRLRNELLTVGGANSASWWPARLAAANTDGFTLYEDNKYVGRTDHACFYQAGRPAVHLFTGTHAEYHTPLDDPPLLNTEGLLRIAEFAARLVEDLAAAPTLSSN